MTDTLELDALREENAALRAAAHLVQCPPCTGTGKLGALSDGSSYELLCETCDGVGRISLTIYNNLLKSDILEDVRNRVQATIEASRVSYGFDDAVNIYVGDLLSKMSYDAIALAYEEISEARYG